MKTMLSYKFCTLILLSVFLIFIGCADNSLEGRAVRGDRDAQYNLGVMHDRGEGVPKDHQEAVRWYRMAAEQGHADAQYNLGVMHADGEGIPQNHQEAIRWYRMAAEQGHAGAQVYLASAYLDGRGTIKDLISAYAWINIAAVSGLDDVVEFRENLQKELSRDQLLKAQNMSREIHNRIQANRQ